MAVPSAVFLLGKQGYPERRDIGMFSFAGILECFSFQEYPCVSLCRDIGVFSFAGISGCSPLQWDENPDFSVETPHTLLSNASLLHHLPPAE